ncbi:hypothetical protein AB835_08925 [Candidatus Endobugula sertula]|uniref:histidine kinase n=1 Tax=Candidatus Endobugula sertula TaxID=62101 RepID=A0A1D2QP95_9GAMM|nr:hypothetical protein AB835_08925 [Candidatus Endobugula sertula]
MSSISKVPDQAPATKRLPIAGAFTLFLLISMLLLGTGIGTVVVIQADNILKNSREEFIRFEMKNLSRKLNSYIQLHRSVLKDYATFPLMIQSVMQPKSNLANVQDFMDDLLVLGNQLPLTLFDLEGNPIYETMGSNCLKEWNDLDSKLELAANSQLTLLICNHKDQQQNHWILLAPVFYHQQIEGYLTATLSNKKLIADLSLNEYAERHHIEIHKDKERLIELGTPLTTPASIIPLPELALTLSYRVDESSLSHARRSLSVNLIISLALIFCIMIVVSKKLGHYYLVAPLERLGQLTFKLAEGNQVTFGEDTQPIREIQALGDQLKSMAGKIRRRETSINKAKEQLVEQLITIEQREQALQTANEKLANLNAQIIEQQQLLVHSEKLASVGQLAAGVAHEINNPTGFVMGNLGVLKDYSRSIQELLAAYKQLEQKLAEDARYQEQLENINTIKQDCDMDYILEDIDALLAESLSGTERIQHIVKDLKSFSRTNDNEVTNVDLNEEVIEAALCLVWNELKYKCTLEKELAALPKVDCIPSEVSQVIMNLLVNASDAIAETGTITLKSYTKGEWVFMEVSDTGSGISEENTLKLFDPFYTTKEIGKGTGLGLAISQGIIKNHGGIITVTSELGKGTTFTIRLPIQHKDHS